jgi:galactitol-specific phosphotransferase system IIB component
MKKIIAIEPTLSNVGEYLSSKGYQVESVNYGMDYTKADPYQYAAVIISGQNKDFLGVQDALTKSVVLNAEGMTPQEIYNELKKRIQ